MVKPDRRPRHERDAIRALMRELGVNYTTALIEYERRNTEALRKAEIRTEK